MYKFISAKEKHMDQIVAFVEMTGYYDATIEGNKLGLKTIDFMRELVIKPSLHLATVVTSSDSEDNVLGVIICGTKDEISQLPDYSLYINPNIYKFFKNVFEFEITNSYYIANLAISPKARGQGIARMLIEFAQKQAHQRKLTISALTVSCQSSIIMLLTKMGLMITKVISAGEEVPFKEFLYFEKKPEFINAQGYFETDEYKKLSFLN
jgi:ribosomal protein S18 acetylase RimI-like enzyme